MAVTNVTKNTVSTSNITNDVFTSASKTWADADFTWGEGGGTWANPYAISNVAKNTSTITNISIS